MAAVIPLANPGEYIDDWSTFRVPTPDMALAFRKFSEWKQAYESMSYLQELWLKLNDTTPDWMERAVDHAYAMMRKWEFRQSLYVDQNGGWMSMASGVPRLQDVL